MGFVQIIAADPVIVMLLSPAVFVDNYLTNRIEYFSVEMNNSSSEFVLHSLVLPTRETAPAGQP